MESNAYCSLYIIANLILLSFITEFGYAFKWLLAKASKVGL